MILTSHISQNENFTVLAFFEAADRKSKRRQSLLNRIRDQIEFLQQSNIESHN